MASSCCFSQHNGTLRMDLHGPVEVSGYIGNLGHSKIFSTPVQQRKLIQIRTTRRAQGLLKPGTPRPPSLHEHTLGGRIGHQSESLLLEEILGL